MGTPMKKSGIGEKIIPFVVQYISAFFIWAPNEE